MAQEHGSWLADYLGHVLTALGSALAAVFGGVWWVVKKYQADRRRCLRLQIHVDKMDTRVSTLAEAIETIIERQDAADKEQQSQRILLTEIKTDVGWIRQELEVAGYRRRQQ